MTRQKRQGYCNVACGFMVFCLSATPSVAETLGQGGDDHISYLRVVLALLLCLALAIGVPYVMKVKGYGLGWLPVTLRRDTRLQLVERLRLGPQADLCLVRLDEIEYLVAISAGRIRILKQLPVGARILEPSS